MGVCVGGDTGRCGCVCGWGYGSVWGSRGVDAGGRDKKRLPRDMRCVADDDEVPCGAASAAPNVAVAE